MNLGKSYGPVVGFLLSSTGWPTKTAAIIATSLVVLWTSALDGAREASDAAIALWMAIYLYRLLRFLFRWLLSRTYRQRRHRKRGYFFTILLLICGLLIWTQLPMILIFRSQHAAINQLAKRYYEQSPMLNPPRPPDYVGIYRIDAVLPDPNGVSISSGPLVLRYSPYREPWKNYRLTRGISVDSDWLLLNVGEMQYTLAAFGYLDRHSRPVAYLLRLAQQLSS